MMRAPSPGLVLLCALLAGALLRDVLVTAAHADEDVLRRSDVTAIVRALEQQAKATQDVAREVRDASRACK